MAKKLNPKEIEQARQKMNRADRRAERKQLLHAEIETGRQGKGVVIIPPANQGQADPANRSKIRVAAYCRVSTQEEEQINSFEMQVHHFRERIENNPAWELVDIYADEGISGTSTHKRVNFQRMIQDADAGKFDLILCKSISRFGRNVVDVLDNLRHLSKLPKPVTVEFETEGITNDGKNNLLITILSAVAEMESQQKSEAIKAGIRYRMAEGIYKFSVHRTLGYYRDNFGRLVIEPMEATIVRFIYESCLEGATPSQIANSLTEQGISSPMGKSIFFLYGLGLASVPVWAEPV